VSESVAFVTGLKLAILTPTRNRLGFLKQNVESVHFSNLAPLDLQLVHSLHDCGSDDGTAAWLATLTGDRIHVGYSPGPVPPGAARNLAAAAVDSDYLMPLDDDDLLLQRSAHHFVHTLSGSGAAWAVADFLKIDQEGRYLAGQDYYAWRFGTAEEMLQAIFSGRHFIQGNVCFTRALFTKTGGYAEDMSTAEDLELYVRFLLEAGLPAYVPMISHLHRMHGDNVSKDIGKDRYNEDMERIYDRHRRSLEERGIALELIP
jgi:glycosyltransferase involved in cell wall biosynthesis